MKLPEIIAGATTDTARWDRFTSDIGGHYRWWGIAWGWVFFGVMIRIRPDN